MQTLPQFYMGTAAKKPCGKLGCGKLTDTSYCEKHTKDNPRMAARKQFDQIRGTRQQRGYGPVWQRLRLLILRRDPFCMIGKICDPANTGRRAPSKEVDHVIPAVARPDLFFDENNLQGACHECHSWKTATQDSEFAKTKE